MKGGGDKKNFMRPDKSRSLIDIQKMFQFKIHKDTREAGILTKREV